MDNYELNGLRAIIGSDAAMHGIEMPPENATPEEYDAWWVRTHFWRVTSHPAAPGGDGEG